jgi:hypothetical protein
MLLVPTVLPALFVVVVTGFSIRKALGHATPEKSIYCIFFTGVVLHPFAMGKRGFGKRRRVGVGLSPHPFPLF